MNKAVLSVVAVLILLAAGTWYVTQRLNTFVPPVEPPQDIVHERVSLEGVWECLPVKNPDEPHTLECALGIGSGGLHYGIDTALLSTSTPLDYAVGTKLHVEGLLIAVEELSSDRWQKYDMVGIIRAQVLEKVE